MSDKDLTPEIFKATVALLTKKAQDYNADRLKNDPTFKLDDKREEYFPFGDKSYVHMLWTKILRIRNLVDKEGEPSFEGIEDSLIDLCAYSAFYYTFLQEKKVTKADAAKKVDNRILLNEGKVSATPDHNGAVFPGVVFKNGFVSGMTTGTPLPAVFPYGNKSGDVNT